MDVTLFPHRLLPYAHCSLKERSGEVKTDKFLEFFFSVWQRLLLVWICIRACPFLFSFKISKFDSSYFLCSLIRRSQMSYKLFFLQNLTEIWRRKPFKSEILIIFWQFSSYCAEIVLLGDLIISWKQNYVPSLHFSVYITFLCPLVWAQWSFVFRNVSRQCTVGRPVVTGAQISLKVVLFWPKNGNLLWARACLVIRSFVIISVILQDRSMAMTTCPHSYSIPVFGRQTHGNA